VRRPLILVILVALAAPGVAGERHHTVRPGESASAIARDHYGDVKLGELLLRYNGHGDTTLRIGEELRIPYCEVHRVGPGDTWSALAQRYLGGASLHPVLALLNDRKPGDTLRVGQSIKIPVMMPHELLRGESLAKLAERYYGNPVKGAILREANGIEDPRRLAVGTPLRIPLLSLWLRDMPAEEPGVSPAARSSGAMAPPESATPVPEFVSSPAPMPAPETVSAPAAIPAGPAPAEDRIDEPPVDRFTEALDAAAHRLALGAFDDVREELEALLPRIRAEGSARDRAEAGRLLAFTYVALDLPERACAAYEAVPPAPLDPDAVSPKIRAVLADCPRRRSAL
jgi:LysM repeat protein